MLGLFLIGLILIGFSVLNAPSDEEIANLKKQQDSIALVNQQEAITKAANLKAVQQKQNAPLDVVLNDTLLNDSLKLAKAQDLLDDFAYVRKDEFETSVLFELICER